MNAPKPDDATSAPRRARPKRSLSDVLGRAVAAEAQADQPQPKEQPEPARAKPVGVPLVILVTAADRRRLRQLSLDSDTSLQQLGHAAWNLLLREKGHRELEPTTANRPSGLKRA